MSLSKISPPKIQKGKIDHQTNSRYLYSVCPITVYFR